MFGPVAVQAISIAEAPLVAGLGSSEFSGFNIIASAFYVDFDSPAVRNLPEIIREQRPSVEESLEWTVAHLVAHQWWGAAVGNDPAREPVLDEALSCWSALLYYKKTYGEEKAAAVLEDQVEVFIVFTAPLAATTWTPIVRHVTIATHFSTRPSSLPKAR